MDDDDYIPGKRRQTTIAIAMTIPCGCGSKLIHQGTAGLSPCFHLPRFHFGYLFLTHSHVWKNLCQSKGFQLHLRLLILTPRPPVQHPVCLSPLLVSPPLNGFTRVFHLASTPPSSTWLVHLFSLSPSPSHPHHQQSPVPLAPDLPSPCPPLSPPRSPLSPAPAHPPPPGAASEWVVAFDRVALRAHCSLEAEVLGAPSAGDAATAAGRLAVGGWRGPANAQCLGLDHWWTLWSLKLPEVGESFFCCSSSYFLLWCCVWGRQEHLKHTCLTRRPPHKRVRFSQQRLSCRLGAFGLFHLLKNFF